MDAEFIDREYLANRERGMTDTQAFEAARQAEDEAIKREQEREKEGSGQ